jgi:acyl-ACP thioesterase
VRASDTDRTGLLRLDGVARYLQDMGFDHLDAVDARATHPYWVVRRTVIDMIQPAALSDHVHLSRWCSGISSRWCNMRVRIENDSGALVETEGFWINLNPSNFMPGRMTDHFQGLLGESAVDPKLRWRSWLPAVNDTAGAVEFPFALRECDIDIFDHVNNAVYWQAVEEHLARRPELRGAPRRAVLEYNAPIKPEETMVLRVVDQPSSFTMAFVVNGENRAVAQVTAIG